MSAPFLSHRLRRAARILANGGVAGRPAEAVFGLGCDPWDWGAVARILTIEGRPVSKGLIAVAADFTQLAPYLSGFLAATDARMQIRAQFIRAQFVIIAGLLGCSSPGTRLRDIFGQIAHRRAARVSRSAGVQLPSLKIATPRATGSMTTEEQGAVLKKLSAVLIVTTVLTAPAMAGDLSTRAAIGGGLGGALGALVGSEVGGRSGAILGGGLGGALGSAVSTNGYRERRYVEREYYYYPAKPRPRHPRHRPHGWDD
jgi:hypothetical protein